MKKMILTPADCGLLIPQWPLLKQKKIARLYSMSTRNEVFPSFKGTTVMDFPPILILEDGFILNGKHRAAFALRYSYNLEACETFDENDIRYNTPHRTYGETGVEGVLEAYSNKFTYISYCNNRRVHCVRDLLS